MDYFLKSNIDDHFKFLETVFMLFHKRLGLVLVSKKVPAHRLNSILQIGRKYLLKIES